MGPVPAETEGRGAGADGIGGLPRIHRQHPGRRRPEETVVRVLACALRIWNRITRPVDAEAMAQIQQAVADSQRRVRELDARLAELEAERRDRIHRQCRRCYQWN